MTVSISHLQPIVALVAGILILVMPRLLNYIVAIYLIIVGIIGLGNHQVAPGLSRPPSGAEQRVHFRVRFQTFTCAGSACAGFPVWVRDAS